MKEHEPSPLALLGGVPVRPQGPPDWPPPDPEVWQALQAAFGDGSWGKYHGAYVNRFEEKLARYHGVAHALTCGSGTFAVELALRSLKIGPGDEVILAAYDYPGNFLSVHALGAFPVLVDIDAGSWNLDPELLEAAISPATRAVIVSHLHGGMVAMARVMELAGRHGLKVVEDACQCPGAAIEDRLAGAWGDVGVLSFGGSKLLTSGRGGAIITPQRDVWQRARLVQHRGNVVCPLSELQAAVLVPQLAKLDERNILRAERVAYLVELLMEVPGLRPLRLGAPGRPGYYKVGFQFDEAQFGLTRDQFVAALRAEGIAFDAGFAGLHVGRSPARFRTPAPLPNADRAHRSALILHHPVLLASSQAVEEVAMAVQKVYANRHCLGG